MKLLLRDRMSLFWFMVFPIIMTVLFGYLVPNVGNQSKIMVVSDGTYTKEHSMVQKLLSVPNTEWAEETPEGIIQEFKNGYLSMVVSVSEKDGFSLHYREEHKDGVVQVLSDVILLENAQAKIDFVDYENVKSIRPIDFILPGMIVLTIMQIGLFGGNTLLIDRNSQILRRLKTNGIKASEIILSHILSRILLVLASVLLLTIVGKWVLSAHLDLSQWYILIPITLVAGFSFLCMGLLIASLFRSPEAGTIFSQSINFPMAFLCGIFFPLSTVPDIMQKIAAVLPLTPLVDTFRGLLLAIEVSQMDIMMTVLILIAWGMTSLGLGSIMFKWE